MSVDALPPEFDDSKVVMAKLIWDLIEHDQVPYVMGLLNMVPPGPDGREMACEESHYRMIQIGPLANDIQSFAAKISLIVMTAILKSAAVDIDQKTLEDLISQNGDFLTAGARVIVAHLLATKALKHTRLDPTNE